MSRCQRCNLNINDNTMICPLCDGVIEGKTEKNLSNIYPYVEFKMKKMKLVVKLFVFVSVLIEMLLLGINYAVQKKISWSLLCGVALVYVCFTVYYSFQRNTGHRRKIAAQTIVAMLVIVAIDYIVGFDGWSIDIAIPIIFMSMDLTLFIIMLANRAYWQNYLMLLIAFFMLSLVWVGLLIAGVVTMPVLTIVAAGVTGLLLFGVMLFGNDKASRELSIKFKM